ncbi:hypothetical protein PQD19_gp030 [Salmonella phage vB_SAg-RPN213]|uniref:hypothetical protein n=1 Tax=Salmonella phage vB_SAg-RPN213 TaxID=2910949 RepID=UPI0023293F1E|nr:hypothetical protein PQD19_gp030 [Salmonella phage vB_SAg-RPN213]UJD21663.1 hypothetical protein RPN213_gp119 [Salmonella phage vB_SAg-RPN213]
MASRKIKVGDEVNVKHEYSYKMLTIRSYKVYQVEAIHEDGTFSLKDIANVSLLNCSKNGALKNDLQP